MKKLIFIIIIIAFIPVICWASCSDEDSTEICSEPDLPELSGAGTTFVDQRFGTTILQVTDSDDNCTSDLCRVPETFWPGFNYDSSAFWIQITSACIAAYIYDFSWPTATKMGQLWANTGANPCLRENTMQWHRDTDYPDRMYGFGQSDYGDDEDKKLYYVDIDYSAPYDNTTHSYHVLKDFSGTLSNNGQYLTISDDNDYFAFIDGEPNYQTTVYVWQESTDTTHSIASNGGNCSSLSNIHSLTMDKSGQYLVWREQAGSFCVWDHILGTTTLVTGSESNQWSGHRVILDGRSVNHAYTNGDRVSHALSSPTAYRSELDFSDFCSGCTANEGHLTGFASDDWVIASAYKSGGVIDDALDQEIYKLWVDGTENHWLRLAHHRSTAFRYEAQPQGNVSFDGNYVMFNSDWETGTETNVFIIQMPSGGDITAPTISGESPSGEQSCNTDPQTVVLEVTTDEDATCRYFEEDTCSTAWASMTEFDSTGLQTHQQSVSKACGDSYEYCVLCQDAAENESDYAEIEFSIASPSVSSSFSGSGVTIQ